MYTFAVRALLRAQSSIRGAIGHRDDRGDVPGWVMVVVMTAGICAVLYGIAKTQLTGMLQSALNEVK